jgi:hypothetical protein
MTEVPSIPAVQPWPAGTTAYPPVVDTFTSLTDGQFAKDINDITSAILAIQSVLGTSPAGAHPSVKLALSSLQSALTTLQGDTTDLADQVAALQSTPGPVNTFYNFTQPTPSAAWDITHNLGRFAAVTVIDSGGSVVEGEIDYVSVNRLTIAFSAAFSGTASLS